MGGGGRERSRLDDGSASEVVVEDGLSVSLEDGFGGHCDEERKMEWMERERKSKSKRVCQKVKKQRRW